MRRWFSALVRRVDPRGTPLVRGESGKALNFRPARRTSVGRRLLRDRYEPEVVQLLTGLLRRVPEGRIAYIDVGANIGYFPLLLLHAVSDAQTEIDCYAHEPFPELFRIALELQRRNGIGYSLSPVALSDFVGTAKFYISSRSDSSSSLERGFRRAKEVIEVEVSTLDETYSERLAQGRYGEIIIKIDVETSEPAVLRGGEGIMERFRPLIVCEVLAGRTERALGDIFGATGYRAFRYNGFAWTSEDRIFGDTTYTFRDWFFVPEEREEEFLGYFTAA